VTRALLEELVSIDSVNPTLVPGAAGEAEIGRFVAGWLERHGVEVEYHERTAEILLGTVTEFCA
jgi:acetylornithine deacetylase